MMLGGVASVAYFITGHEQTQLNRDLFFHFFGVFLASKGSNYLELICNCSKFMKLSLTVSNF